MLALDPIEYYWLRVCGFGLALAQHTCHKGGSGGLVGGVHYGTVQGHLFVSRMQDMLLRGFVFSGVLWN